MKDFHPRDLFHSIFRTAFILDKTAEKILSESLNLSLSQFRILMAIDSHQGLISQKDIAMFWGVSMPAINRQIGLMEKVEFVTSDSSVRKLGSKLLITKKGKEILRKAFLILDDKMVDAQSSLKYGLETQETLDSLSDFILKTYPNILPCHSIKKNICIKK